ncbi:Rare lipoprotein A [Penicillium camemberti]|uniref:Rare lipoprotein A n=1 Tax=Penicillium camemberti (strain FM 013) TaxID=1429867 RepID=A0A0G4PR84_PENC3|nr:Rare lipoprotein A [Penicillium camemberti]
MKYLRLASVAALVSAATVSAGPLGAREHDGYCPKGYTMSVYYKTVTVETYPTATSVETTVTPTSTPVTVESQSSAEPTVASSSTAIAVESTTPAPVVQIETTTSEASVAETSAAETSAAEVAVVKTAPVAAVLPTTTAETAAVVKTIAAPAVETTAAQTSTTQAPVEVASTSTTQAPVEAASTSTESATSSSSTKSASSKSVSTSSSDGTPGEATFYGGNVAGGTCSFSGYTLPSNLFGAALSLQRWDDAAECGACVSVTGPKGNSIKAMIVDQCPECESNHIDLFQDAFAELSDISAGIIQTTWSYVSCDLDGPLKLKNKEGTSAYWFSMQVVNANEAVTALEVSTDGGSSWKSTTRTYYNFFENTAGFGTSTVDVRITGASGKTVVVKDVGVSSGNEVTAASNL